MDDDRRCLVVGGEGALLAALEPLLVARGFAVERAASPAAAAGPLHERPWEVLVAIPAPGDPGLDLLDQLRSLPRGRAPLALVLAEAGQPAVVRQLLDAGAFGVLLRPLAAAQVEAELVRVERELDRLRALGLPVDPAERFELLFEKNPYPMWFYDRESLAFLAVNEAAVAAYGFTRKEFQRMTLRDIRPPEDLADLHRAIEHAHGQARLSGTYRHRKRDGTVFPVEVQSCATTFNGRAAALVVALDITERRELESRLTLSDRLATMGAMAAGVAHEINNPLTYVLGNIAFVQNSLEELPPGTLVYGAELIEALAEAERGSERVREIVRNLRSLSQGADQPSRSIDLRRSIEGALAMAAGRIRHCARLVVEWADVPPVLASEGKLGQVFLNLLLNAAQAIPVGNVDANEIRVATWAEPGMVACAVSDTGSGIAPEHLDHIFDPFFTTKDAGQGTGLGLSICHSIVSSLGGSISVESTTGRGSRFVVRLPIAQAVPTHPARGAERRRPPEHLRVLVVDDEELVGRSVRRMLGSDCDTVVESSAPRALARLQGGELFDLVLCDLMMPELSGVDFYERLQRVAPAAAARLAFVTGGAFATREQEFLERSQVPRLEKPIDLDKLLALLERPG